MTTMNDSESAVVLGLDLAGTSTRPTGLCVLTDLEAETKLVYGDAEIAEEIRRLRPVVIAVDAPLSLPRGRKSIEERTDVHLRECDRELLKRRIKFFPVTIGPMRKLTARGIALKESLKETDTRVIEVYPGGAQDVLRIPRKQRGLDKLKEGLEKLGIKGLTERLSDHELDAVTCAYVGYLFLSGKACNYGTRDQVIVMPQDEKGRRPVIP